MADDGGSDDKKHDIVDEKMRVAHDSAHDLASVLIAALGEWIASRPPETVTLGSILIGSEILPSMIRRICRDLGLPKEAVKELQKLASGCALSFYDLHKTMVNTVADDVFVIKPDAKFEH